MLMSRNAKALDIRLNRAALKDSIQPIIQKVIMSICIMMRRVILWEGGTISAPKVKRKESKINEYMKIGADEKQTSTQLIKVSFWFIRNNFFSFFLILYELVNKFIRFTTNLIIFRIC